LRAAREQNTSEKLFNQQTPAGQNGEQVAVSKQQKFAGVDPARSKREAAFFGLMSAPASCGHCAALMRAVPTRVTSEIFPWTGAHGVASGDFP
jgi:hypothetical protein